MVVRSMSRSYELVRTLDLKGVAIHGLWRTLQDGEEQFIHMIQISKKDLDREWIPYIQEMEENKAFTDLSEVFFDQDFVYMAFQWRDGIPLNVILETQNLTMEQRFTLGKAVLERILILNLPLFLQRDALNAEEILVATDLSVDFNYSFSDMEWMSGTAETASRFAGLIDLLFAAELKGGLYPELKELRERLWEDKSKTVLAVYQEYLSLAGIVNQERKPPEKEKKEPFLARIKKKTGIFIMIFKITAGLAVISASALLLYDGWKEKVYPVMESAYLVKTFFDGDEALDEYSGKVEILNAETGKLLYRGKLEDGKKTGYGAEYERNGGLLYEGNFLAGRYDGQGMLYSRTGKLLYEGNFQAGVYDGSGSLYDEAGILIYAGSFVQGKKEGYGTDYDSDGRVIYEGEFKKGVCDGEGRLYGDGRLCYEGEFSDGVPGGEGVSYEDGKVKEAGRFEHGVFVEGKGYLYNEDGSVCYSGAVLSGKPEGEGTWYDGELIVYEGSFKKGVYDGEGRLFSGGSTLYRGTFAEGLYEGQGVLYSPVSGTPVYSGMFRLGLYDGEGMEYDPAGNLLYQGNFLLGVYNGYGILYDPATGKTEQEGEFRNGILITPKEELQSDGEKTEDSEMADGMGDLSGAEAADGNTEGDSPSGEGQNPGEKGGAPQGPAEDIEPDGTQPQKGGPGGD